MLHKLTPFILIHPCAPHTLGRDEEMKEKVCLCGIHVVTCQIFV